MWALPVFGGLFLLLLILSCIPIETRVNLDTTSSKPVRIETRWLFGMIKRVHRTNKKQVGSKQEQFKSSEFSLSELYRFLQGLEGIPKRVITLMKDVYRQLSIKGVTGDFEIGFEEPDYTGMVFAVIGPVNAVLNTLPKYNVTITPSFDEEDVIRGNLQGVASVMPVRLMIPAVKFLSSQDSIKAGKTLIARSRKRKRSQKP